MMSSMDMSSSSAGASATSRTTTSNPPPHHPQYQHPQSRYAGQQQQRSGSPAPLPHAQYSHHQSHAPVAPPPRAEAGRLMSEQVVLELLNKVTELVLQSRVHLQNEAGLYTTTSSARRGRFNLDIEEIPHIRESMGAWREDVHTPLTVDIFWDGDGEQRVLLERWSLVYTNGLSVANAGSDQFDAFNFHGRRHSSNVAMGSAKSYAAVGNSRPVIDILKDVVKKFTVLLRAVHSFMRLLPAHRFFRQSYPSTLSYEIHSCDETQLASGFEMGIATSQYSFLPINTPFGFVKLSTLYRRDCSALERRRKRASKEIFDQNVIIQDYVPASPELMAASSRHSPSPPTTNLGQTISPRGKPTNLDDNTDDAGDRRRRSSPELISSDGHASPRRGMHRPHQQQQYQHQPRHYQQSPPQTISQPMAIPQQVKTPVPIATTYDDQMSTTISAHDNKPVAIQQHAHSYGEPGRLRSVATNPNVSPAPYGYGNVAIERTQTPPIGFLGGSSSGFSAGAGGSYQDHNLSSPHPLSTPPRHPHSQLTPRLSGGSGIRTSFVSSMSSSSAKKSNNEYAYRASLENFSLDTSGPSPLASPAPSPSAIPASPAVETRGRAQAFHFGGGRRQSTEFDSSESRSPTPELAPMRAASRLSGSGASGSPQLTPPFMAATDPLSADGHPAPSTTAALVLRRMPLDQSPTMTGGPVFASSPPFQANPSELLSTSPGYSHSKHFQALRRGGAPTFMSTDAAFVGRNVAAGTAGAVGLSNSGGRSSGHNALGESRTRTFSNTNIGGMWGISPDSPDTFTFSVGASTRRRCFSSLGDGGGGTSGGNSGPSNATAAQDDDGDMESEMMMLPFALTGDVRTLSSATTVTATSSASEQGQRLSSLGFADNARSGTEMAWDTASVGGFLQQLKNAPRLQTFDRAMDDVSGGGGGADLSESLAGRRRGSSARPSPSADDTAPPPTSFFDDELESFRNLRNELTQAM